MNFEEDSRKRRESPRPDSDSESPEHKKRKVDGLGSVHANDQRLGDSNSLGDSNGLGDSNSLGGSNNLGNTLRDENSPPDKELGADDADGDEEGAPSSALIPSAEMYQRAEGLLRLNDFLRFFFLRQPSSEAVHEFLPGVAQDLRHHRETLLILLQGSLSYMLEGTISPLSFRQGVALVRNDLLQAFSRHAGEVPQGYDVWLDIVCMADEFNTFHPLFLNLFLSFSLGEDAINVAMEDILESARLPKPTTRTTNSGPWERTSGKRARGPREEVDDDDSAKKPRPMSKSGPTEYSEQTQSPFTSLQNTPTDNNRPSRSSLVYAPMRTPDHGLDNHGRDDTHTLDLSSNGQEETLATPCRQSNQGTLDVASTPSNPFEAYVSFGNPFSASSGGLDPEWLSRVAAQAQSPAGIQTPPRGLSQVGGTGSGFLASPGDLNPEWLSRVAAQAQSPVGMQTPPSGFSQVGGTGSGIDLRDIVSPAHNLSVPRSFAMGDHRDTISPLDRMLAHGYQNSAMIATAHMRSLLELDALRLEVEVRRLDLAERTYQRDNYLAAAQAAHDMRRLEQDQAHHKERIAQDQAHHEERIAQDQAHHEERIEQDKKQREEKVAQDQAHHEEKIEEDKKQHEEKVTQDQTHHDENLEQKERQHSENKEVTAKKEARDQLKEYLEAGCFESRLITAISLLPFIVCVFQSLYSFFMD